MVRALLIALVSPFYQRWWTRFLFHFVVSNWLFHTTFFSLSPYYLKKKFFLFEYCLSHIARVVDNRGFLSVISELYSQKCCLFHNSQGNAREKWILSETQTPITFRQLINNNFLVLSQKHLFHIIIIIGWVDTICTFVLRAQLTKCLNKFVNKLQNMRNNIAILWIIAMLYVSTKINFYNIMSKWNENRNNIDAILKWKMQYLQIFVHFEISAGWS